MAGEIENLINEPSESEKRIKQLSDSVKAQAAEKDDALKQKAESDTKAADAEKRAAFAEGFADMVSTNPAAKDFKADIQAKVMSGYSVEDATYAVLGKAGKIGSAVAETESPAGGSSTTTVTSQGDKSVGEMTQDERRKILLERDGELIDILGPKQRL